MLNVGVLEVLLRLRDEMGPQLERSASKMKATGTRMMQTGKALSLGLTAPLVAAGSASLAMATNFDSSLKRIETLVGLSSEQVQGYRDDILSLSGETARAPKELADALFVVTSAGARGAEAMDILRGSAQASASGLGDTAAVARTVTSVIQAYGSENIDASRALDILTATVREGNLEAGELAGSLGKVLGMAAEAGVSFDEAGAFVATFTRLGVSASEAVTGLRGTLSAVIRPTEQSRAALKDMNWSLDGLREAIRERGLTAALGELVERADGNTDAIARVVPEVEALAGVLGTAGAQGEEFTQIQKNIAESLGTLDEAFKKTQEDAGFQIKQLGNDIRLLALSIGDELVPVIKPVIAQIREWLASFRELSPETQKIILAVGAAAAAIGPLLVAAGALVSAFGAIAPVIGTVVAVLSGPVGLIALLGGLLLSIRPVREALVAVFSYLKDRALDLLGRLQAAMRKWGETWDWIKGKLGLASDEVARNTVEITTNRGQVETLREAMQRMAPEITTNTGRVKTLAESQREAAEAAKKHDEALQAILATLPPLGQSYEDFLGDAVRPGLEGLNQMNLAMTEQAAALGALSASFLKAQQDFVASLSSMNTASALASDMAASIQDEVADTVFVLDPPVEIPGTGSFMGSIKKLFSGGSALGQGITGALGGLFSGDGVGDAITNGLKAGLSMAANAIVPGLGTLMAPLIDGLMNLFSGLFSKTDAADIAQQWGLNLSEALTSEIQQLGDQLGRDYGTAIRLSLDKVIDEMGVSTIEQFQKFATMARETFASFDQGVISGSQAIDAVGRSLSALIPFMDELGLSADALTPVFSDLVNRVKLGMLDIGEAEPLINSLIQQMIDLGVEGVESWIKIAEAAGISIDVQKQALDQGQAAWIAWAESVGVSFEKAERHNRAYFERLAQEMGLAGETAEAWIDGMLKNQREANKEFEKSQRQMFRQAAIDADLSGDQIREFVRANMKQIRQAERQAERERKNERRAREVEEIGSGKLVKDRMIYFADVIQNRWIRMYGEMEAASRSFAQTATTTSLPAGTTAGGRAAGSPGTVFEDFGSGTPMVLHGRETVVTEDQGASLAGMVGAAIRNNSGGASSRGVEERLDRLERTLLTEMPRALGRAVKSAQSKGGRS